MPFAENIIANNNCISKKPVLACVSSYHIANSETPKPTKCAMTNRTVYSVKLSQFINKSWCWKCFWSRFCISWTRRVWLSRILSVPHSFSCHRNRMCLSRLCNTTWVLTNNVRPAHHRVYLFVPLTLAIEIRPDTITHHMNVIYMYCIVYMYERSLFKLNAVYASFSSYIRTTTHRQRVSLCALLFRPASIRARALWSDWF